MSLRQRALRLTLALLSVPTFGVLPITAQDAPAETTDERGIEVITVTARKKEENLQDIPIAVSAFSADDLSTSNIDDVADVQFNVPNLQFSKTNFMGAGNISLRGVGNLATASTAEIGVGIHVNEAPFAGARVFETEFFDVDRVEVLRGPQGTLFGRSAPGGALNLYTKKPVFEEFGGSLHGEYGDFNHGKIKGVMNVPLGEHFAARFGGYYFHRDGLTDNVANGHEVDDRNLWMVRGSLAGEWDDVNFNLMASWFEEDDKRMRINKQACTTDARPWPFSIGCQGGDVRMRGDPINSSSILVYSTGIIIDTMHALGPLHNFLLGQPGGSPYTALGFPNRPVTQVPRYLTGPIGVFTPYANPALLGTDGYLASQASGDAMFGPFLGPQTYGTPTEFYEGAVNPSSLRKVNTQLDPRYATSEFMGTLVVNFDVTETLTLTSVTGYHKWYNNSRTDYFWADPTVTFAGGSRFFDFTDSGHHSPWRSLAGNYDSEFVFDRSWGKGDTFSQEIRLASSFDGPINFITGANYSDGSADLEYAVWAAGLEATWDMPDQFLLCPNAAAFITANPGASCHDALPRSSYYLNETKPTTVTSWAVFGEAYWDVLERTQVTLGARYTDDHKESTQRVNLWVCNDDPSTPATCDLNPFETLEGGFHNVTWKVGVSQQFDMSFAPDSMVYFNVTSGFKGGGFNPAVDTSAGGTPVPLIFDEEEVIAYEGGYKGILFDQTVFNITAFYYDYEGMQVSKIVNRTAVNENADVKLYGIELETVWQFTDNGRIDLNAAWLKTDIQKLDSVDPADPTAGTPGWTTIKQLLPFPAGQNAICNQAINPLCLEGTPTNILDCLSDGYCPDGFIQNLKGNELPASPEFNIKVGFQYSLPFFAGWEATPRLDYFWHSESWGRLYNTKKDEIDPWQQLDAQISFQKEGSPFSLELWAKNLQDNDDVTGHYFTDATSANFTNLFILEPRTFGATVRFTFGDSET
jgi:outer membrane receptor protein involved in Fe transport